MLRAAARINAIRNESVSSGNNSSTRPSNPPGKNGFSKLLVALGIGGAGYYAYQNYKPVNHASKFVGEQNYAPESIIQSSLPIPNAGDPETISPNLILSKDASSLEVLENKLKSALITAISKISHVTESKFSSTHSHEGSTGSVVELAGIHRYVEKLDDVITDARNEPSTKNHPLIPLADATSKKLHSQLNEFENFHSPSSRLP
uniref:MICOS complex subunit MIC60 n=1 Tax=Panagrolaimus sp. ES5 TaxID=591445 RepID=A0AC34GXP9_9BILA